MLNRFPMPRNSGGSINSSSSAASTAVHTNHTTINRPWSRALWQGLGHTLSWDDGDVGGVGGGGVQYGGELDGELLLLQQWCWCNTALRPLAPRPGHRSCIYLRQPV